uniref:histidine kinase n=1 Tax=Phenylobacterium glaciei TaxID=2803784 RepID=A0A974S7S3_9CAUL|nr:PAS domain S-box protein [Phenylobacterium glaciei]
MIEWLFANSQELMLVIGPDARFKLVNPAWTTATGWASDEIVGKYAAEFIHPDDLPDFGKLAERLFETRTGQNVARMRMKDGAYRWFEGRSQLTDDGHIIGVLRDVTREREREAELEDARRTRLLLSESAGVGTWTFEPLTGRIDWSDDIRAITGYGPEEVVTIADFEAILHPDEREAVRTAFNRGVLQGSLRPLNSGCGTRTAAGPPGAPPSIVSPADGAISRSRACPRTSPNWPRPATWPWPPSARFASSSRTPPSRWPCSTATCAT